MLFSELFLFISLLAVYAVATQCYCKNDNEVWGGCRGAVPCGSPNGSGFVQCCAPGDICGADGFCHFTHSQQGTSGYYLGSCTDPKFEDASCPQTCTDNSSEDVVYNATSGLWACCYGPLGILDCSDPGSETFYAQPPQALFAKPFAELTEAPPASTSVAIVPQPTTQQPASQPPTTAQQAAPSSNPTQAQSISSQSKTTLIKTAPGTTITSVISLSSSSSVQSPKTSPSSSGATAAAATTTTGGGSLTALTSNSNALSASSASDTSITSSSQPTGLSIGAKVGIAVGVIILSVAIVGLVVFFIRQRQSGTVAYKGRDGRRTTTTTTHEMGFWGEVNKNFNGGMNGRAGYEGLYEVGMKSPAPLQQTFSHQQPWSFRSELPGYGYEEKMRPSELGNF